MLAVAPAALLLKYVLVRDKYKHEPMQLIAVTFLLGALGIVPATVLESLLSSPNILVNAFISTAVVEECVKYFAVRAKAYHSPSLNETMDGIVYGVAAGLGFATVENVLYVLGFGTLSTAIVRAFLSVPSHAAYGGIMGFYLGMAKLHSNGGNSKKNRGILIITGLTIAIVLHGLYDTIALTLDSYAALAGLLIMTMVSWAILLRLIKRAVSLSPIRWGFRKVPMPTYLQVYPYRYCTQCGTHREFGSAFCVNCGHEFT
ncbi:MAG TPA: PrsW family glutamic-type intramembrane protease [Candidatus Bathyarchaeia archaeon]|nr:PrsW family glutamic-type intramembrane protease [Candidatus Bathyarchaeia archaeon]